MDLGLRDKAILVTGGASGIGAGITRACLAEGARVLAVSRISVGVDEFLAEMKSRSLPFEFLTAEVGDPAECKRAVAYAAELYGRLDGLVSNTGLNDGVGLEHGDPQKFEASVLLNLMPAYALAHYALPMLKASHGSIVMVSSKVAVTGQGGTSGYAAAKGGQLALAREWAVELAPYGVRANAVIPAEVMTPAYETWLATLPDPEATLRNISQQVPLGRRMTYADEIAAAVTFLLSPVQSAHTTGQHIFVDGGYIHLDRMSTAAPLR